MTVVGHATAVTDGAEIARLEQSGLMPWAPGNRDHFIRVSPAIVNGAADPRRAGSGGRRCASFLSISWQWCPAVRWRGTGCSR